MKIYKEYVQFLKQCATEMDWIINRGEMDNEVLTSWVEHIGDNAPIKTKTDPKACF